MVARVHCAKMVQRGAEWCSVVQIRCVEQVRTSVTPRHKNVTKMSQNASGRV